MQGIFISYRREDTSGYAGRLYDRLKEHFGRDRVFWDVSGSIEPGRAFDEVIQQAVGSCEALLVLIGRDWLTVSDEQGRRRLDDPDDFIRLETATALRRGIRVVPVLVGGAQMPRAKDLPEDLKALAKRQAIQLTDDRWDFDVGRLTTVLEKILEPRGGGIISRRVKIGAAAVLFLVAAWFVVGVWRPWDRPSRDTRVVVPDVVGLTLEDATRKLEGEELAVGKTDSTPTEQGSGRVLRQDPQSGRRVEKETPVNLVLGVEPSEAAAGPQAASPTPGVPAPPATPEVVVPNLIGREPRAALSELKEIGLAAKMEIYTSAETPPDQVHRQSIRPGTKVDPGTEVLLTASSPPSSLDDGERFVAFRYLSMGERIFFDGGRVQRDDWALVLAEDSALRRLHLAPNRGVLLTLPPMRSDKGEVTKSLCARSFSLLKVGRMRPIDQVPIEESLQGKPFCVLTPKGTTGAVLIRRILDAEDKAGDRALVGYWAWQ